MNLDLLSNSKDVLTIVGLVAGLVCGALMGRNSIYYSMYKTNMLGDDSLDDPSNQLDDSSRFVCGFVGGLFALIGLVILVVSITMRVNYKYPTADQSAYDIYGQQKIDRMLAEEDERKRNDNSMLIVFGVCCIGMGGLVLTPVITGKRRT